MRRHLLCTFVAGASALLALSSVLAQTSPPQGTPRQPGQESGLRTTIHQGELKLPENTDAFRRPKRDRMLKDGDLARGTVGIAAAWFSEPTGRYRHSPFGTDQHPTMLTVSTKERQILRFGLPKDSVFEDRSPRLIDLDGDNREEIVTIRSYERKGSALVVLAVRGRELEIIAETEPIGTPHRWLNPAGFADFNGDGQNDIAIVVTPHFAGELQIWTLKNGTLVKLGETDDVSNHVNGSRHMRLSAISDFNGDGKPDIAIPSQDRRTLRFLTLTGDRIEELGEFRLRVPATEDFEVVSEGGRPAVRVGLSGGRTIVVSPCRDIQQWEMADGSC